ncbi:MAG: hypothetical protein AAF985_26285 [Bacteroidota bacterium]
MKNKIGSPVYGNNFLFREKLLRMGLRLMQNGNSFLMLGIRRTGKSSYLKQVAYLIRVDNPSRQTIEIDCSTYQSVLDFYKGLYSAMPKPMRVRFKKMLEGSKMLPKKVIDFITDIVGSVGFGETKIDFKDKMMAYNQAFEDLVKDFFQSEKNGQVFLFIDELPFFFENISKDDEGKTKEIQMLLTNLRNWRDAGIPIGITGSLNLHQQLEYLGLSRKLLAGLNTITLDTFTRAESEALFTRLLANKHCDWWTEEITHKLLDLLPDYIPYFLQYAFNTIIVNECKTANEVEEVYNNDIIPGLIKDFMYQFEERLKFFDHSDRAAAMILLDHIAKMGTPNLVALQTKIGKSFDYKVLISLMDYEFITLSGQQQYTFTLNIIKNWWKQKRNL